MNASRLLRRALVCLPPILAVAGCDRADRPAGPTRSAAPPAADLQGTFATAGELVTGRSGHVALRLPDGRVLVAGGVRANTRLASTELFDPASGLWTSVAAMNRARLGAAAVLLADGRALVIGGAAFNNCTDASVGGTAEIFDPASGTWTLTAALNESRSSPAAVVLQDGRVLVAGGGDRCGHMRSSTELFDPVAGTWTLTGSLSVGRQASAAVVLLDGRVLLAGGMTVFPFPSLASAELYDPGTGTWSATGGMNEPRIWTSEDVSAAGFLVLLPNGKVLAAGGVSRPDNFGANDLYLRSAELYDPATGTWSPTGDMATPRSEHQLTPLATGQVLVTAGRFSGAVLSDAEAYDPETGAFSIVGALALARYDHTATRLADGRILVAGGLNMLALTSAEIFATGSANRAPVADAGPAVAASEGQVVTFDGRASSDPDGDPLTYLWDFGDGTAPEAGPTPTHTYSDNGTYAVSLTVSDGTVTSAPVTTTATIENVAPGVGAISAPVDPVQTGSVVTASASFTDPGRLDTHTASVDWGDGTSSSGLVSEGDGSGSVSGTHSYLVAGVYLVTLTVTDKDGGGGQAAFEFVIAFDPIEGFVTGGGWIDSPPGAYAADPTLTGKAHFGFVSHYKKGQTTPSGQTEFRFEAGDLNFHSTTYEWLVVAGPRVLFKGSGTINGAEGFDFQVSAVDGDLTGSDDPDRFRIKIWDRNAGGVIYDNQMGDADRSLPTTALNGGSVVIHP